MKYQKQRKAHEEAMKRYDEIRRYARENEGLSQKEIADHFDVSLTTVWNAMNADRETRCQIA